MQTDRAATTVRQKKNTAEGGLVHGTGCVKPNGAIRCSDSNSSKESASEPAPVEPSKQRLIIEQGPKPLYCSYECRLADLNASRGTIDSDYNPDRQSPPPPPISHNSFSFLAFPASQDSKSNSSSPTDSSVKLIDTDRCNAHLASLYGFPPLPLRPCLLPNEPEQKVEPSKQHRSDIMMAARRIKANLCKEEPKRSSFAHLNQPSSKERKLSPVGLIALMVGALRFIPLPSLVITLPVDEFRSQTCLQKFCCFLSTPRRRLLDLGCQVPGTSAVV